MGVRWASSEARQSYLVISGAKEVMLASLRERQPAVRISESMHHAHA